MASAKLVVDLHCHSSASFDGAVAPERLARLARDLGLTHLALTDHDTIDGALRARDQAPSGLTVIVGQEARTREGDMIGLFLERPVPSGLPAADTAALIREQGGVIGLPHPFDAHRPSIAVGATPAEQAALAALIDYVEVHNGRVSVPLANANAADFAREYHLPGVAVSDTHAQWQLGTALTMLTGRAGNAGELMTAVRSGTSLLVREPVPGRAAEQGVFGRLMSLLRSSDR